MEGKENEWKQNKSKDSRKGKACALHVKIILGYLLDVSLFYKENFIE